MDRRASYSHHVAVTSDAHRAPTLDISYGWIREWQRYSPPDSSEYTMHTIYARTQPKVIRRRPLFEVFSGPACIFSRALPSGMVGLSGHSVEGTDVARAVLVGDVWNSWGDRCLMCFEPQYTMWQWPFKGTYRGRRKNGFLRSGFWGTFSEHLNRATAAASAAMMVSRISVWTGKELTIHE